MIGDNPRADIRGANNIGWLSFLTRTGIHTEKGNSESDPATMVVENFSEAIDMVLECKRELSGWCIYKIIIHSNQAHSLRAGGVLGTHSCTPHSRTVSLLASRGWWSSSSSSSNSFCPIWEFMIWGGLAFILWSWWLIYCVLGRMNPNGRACCWFWVRLMIPWWCFSLGWRLRSGTGWGHPHHLTSALTIIPILLIHKRWGQTSAFLPFPWWWFRFRVRVVGCAPW